MNKSELEIEIYQTWPPHRICVVFIPIEITTWIKQNVLSFYSQKLNKLSFKHFEIHTLNNLTWRYITKFDVCFKKFYRRRIENVDQFKHRLTEEWGKLKRGVVAAVIMQWWPQLLAFVQFEGGHFEFKRWKLFKCNYTVWDYLMSVSCGV